MWRDTGKHFEDAIRERYSEYIAKETREAQIYLAGLSLEYKDFYTKILLETICFNELMNASVNSSLSSQCNSSDGSVKLTLPVLLSGILIEMDRLHAFMNGHSNKTQAFKEMFTEMKSLKKFGSYRLTKKQRTER